MIEINLLPGAARKSRRPGLSLSLPSGDLLGSVDRYVLFAVAAWVLTLGVVAFLYFGVTGQQEEVDLAIEQAVQDSARFATLIETSDRLQARQDTVAQKLRVIQEIDAGRYVWPHIMDEVSRALPEFTWLTALVNVNMGGQPVFQLEGRSGNTFAVTQFMEDLEASPFIRNVALITMQQERLGENQVVNSFVLEASYEDPPPEFLETVPLFETGSETSNGQPASE